MRSVAKIILWVIAIAIIIGLVAYFYKPKDQSAGASPDEVFSLNLPEGMITLKAPKGTLKVVEATSSESQAIGLSGLESMPVDQGLLFVFEYQGIYEFWMKDMLFPLDIIWINEDKTVAGISSDLAPETYPETFISPNEVKYVLEVNAGRAATLGIATGTSLVF